MFNFIKEKQKVETKQEEDQKGQSSTVEGIPAEELEKIGRAHV